MGFCYRKVKVCLISCYVCFVLISCLSGRFGKKSSAYDDSKNATISEERRNCFLDEDCNPNEKCCDGFCYRCCRDSDCYEETACGQRFCNAGACRSGEIAYWPVTGGRIDSFDLIKFIDFDGNLLAASTLHVVYLFALSGDYVELKSSLSFEGEITGLILRNEILYVKTYYKGEEKHTIFIVDVNRPSVPYELTALSSDSIEFFDIEEDFMWVISNSIAYIISIISPSDPQIIAYHSIPLEYDSVDAAGNMLVVASKCEGVIILKYSDSSVISLEKMEIPYLLKAKKVVYSNQKFAFWGEFGSNDKSSIRIKVFEYGIKGTVKEIMDLDAEGIEDFQLKENNLLIFKNNGSGYVLDINDGRTISVLPADGFNYILTPDAVLFRLKGGDIVIDAIHGKCQKTIRAGSCRRFSDFQVGMGNMVVGCKEGGVIFFNVSNPAFPVARGFGILSAGIKKVFVYDTQFVAIDENSSVYFLKEITNRNKDNQPVFNYQNKYNSKIVDADMFGHFFAVVDSSKKLRIFHVPYVQGEEPSPVFEATVDATPYDMDIDEENAVISVKTEYGIEGFAIQGQALKKIFSIELRGWGQLKKLSDSIFVYKGENIKRFEKMKTGEWKETWQLPLSGVFDVFASGEFLSAGIKDSLLLFRLSGENGAIKPVLPVSFKGLDNPVKISGNDSAINILGSNAILSYRLSIPEKLFTDVELEQVKGSLPENIIMVSHKEKENFYAGVTGRRYLDAYREASGKLTVIAQMEIPDEIDRICPAGESKVLGFSHGGSIIFFDFSNPANPQITDAVQVGKKITNVSSDGELVCLLFEDGSVGTLPKDLLKSKPGINSAIFFSSGAKVEAGKLRCWVVDSDGGIVIYDATDPYSPEIQNIIPSVITGRIENIRIINDRILAASSDRILVVDISDPDNPQFKNSIKLKKSNPLRILPLSPITVIISSMDDEKFITFIDITNSENAEIKGSISGQFELIDSLPLSATGFILKSALFPSQLYGIDTSCLVSPSPEL